MKCNYCGYWFTFGSRHLCPWIGDVVYISNPQPQPCSCGCGCSPKPKDPISEKLDKIIKLLEKKRKEK